MTLDEVLRAPAPALSARSVTTLLETGWGLGAVEVRPLPSERDLNVLVGGRHVLKVSNPAETRESVELEVAVMAHAAATDPELVMPRTVPTIGGHGLLETTDDAGRACLARVVTVVPGEILEGAVVTSSLAEQVGELAARTSVALQGFFHPAAGGRGLDWDVRRLPDVVRGALVSGVLDPVREPVLAGLPDRVAGSLRACPALPSGVQHADVTLTNVLAHDGRVTGVIDFGDVHHTARVADLAVTLTAVLRNSGPRHEAGLWDLAGAVLRGYQRRQPLQAEEVEVLGDLVLARLAVSTLISRSRAARHTDNVAYITQYDDANARVLAELAALSPGELSGRLHRLAGTAEPHVDGDLGARRAAVMGGPLSPLFYARPLHVARGEGPWLVGDDGRRMLDAYNNVAVVGHAHPTVTRAVTRQFARLNTHSRYLHAGVVRLAERLVATMPEGLDTVLFTTSGTEANELAWRLATEATGGDGALVARHAYHGSTRWMADLSPNEWPPGHRPEGVARFEAPYGDPALLTAATAAGRVRDAAAQLAERGHRPALVLADSGFTSEGVRDAPPAYLQGLVDGAHEAGALFLADEVQVGYGRTGPQLWRFALAGITPDIVTLGKPMGAGYPVGAVVTRRETADALARRYEYFSTFAATPVAAAAGNAVLDVLEAERLPERAVLVGEHLRRGLRHLAATHDAVGEVRGSGLLAGLDLPGRDLAREVLAGLVAHGVLAGLTGPGGDVLKVRPPLVWEVEHADLFVSTLDRVLHEVGGRR
ncbi:aminotransferase class III-fold pyridoxal phosphate-dependent enzyme [Nocardioides sp. cx-169]|uniref:aminotransferase class III-fold pyridoxal phosphate-dependent enzyme n=1 Tax=Nocardioides sp. cx-169 TaxID=2899080 RepID=UPI001E388032|nr:aminotransferase class III-fold pyridoxal phosphate-dependent enzyme [Nocardioides sp. cx-169]MCD4533437.1 aminotransferase class III-fold pyridoxal phosphate-dependent enzyme [Nocardioides sp. cx-169]